MTHYAISTLPGRVLGFLESDTMPVLHDPQRIAHAMIQPVAGWPVAPTPTSELWIANGELYWYDPSTIEQAHAIAWERVKAARDAAEAAAFEFEGGMYDPNKENITGAALAAFMAQMAGVTISRRWTLADNSRRTLAGPQLIDLGYKLTTRVDAVHETGRRLRDQLEAIKNTPGATPADLYAVTWPTEEFNAVE